MFAAVSRGGTPQPRMCKSSRFLIALPANGPDKQTGFFISIAGNAGRRVFRAHLHGVGGGHRLARAAGGGTRALGCDGRVARPRTGGGRTRWTALAADRRRARAAELVGRV